jgi:hypothetical protein
VEVSKQICLGQNNNKIPILGMEDADICGAKPIVVLTIQEDNTYATFDMPVCLQCWNRAAAAKAKIVKVTPIVGNI